MNKFFRSVRSSDNNKDNIIKQSLTSQLSNSVKEIQYASIDDNKTSKTNDIIEASNTLCNVLEAMFLHGLRDTLTHRFKRALADLDEQPEPSFWAPLLVISHRQIIDQITNLSQITSDVGQCRAWIRLALNDCLLSSYLMTMRLDSSALKSYYRVDAFIRDSELLDVAQRLIEGVEAFKTFTLPFNSSLLNSWPLPSLILAGIWSPTLKTVPVAPCDDVALSITDTMIVQNVTEVSSETASLSSAMSVTSQGSSGLRQIVALTEDEVLRIILDKDKQKVTSNKTCRVDDHKPSINSDQEGSSESDNVSHNIGNSLKRRSGWSFDETEIALKNEVSNGENEELDREEKTMTESKSMEASYNALIESYNMLSGGCIRTPDIREVWRKFEDERNNYVSTHSSIVGQSESETIVSREHLADSEATALAIQIGKIARERGLDNQNYECADCKSSLGFTNKSTLCSFTGDYFCDNCISSELVQIPARIVHNWDFKTYSISRKGKKYIEEVKDHPVLDFKVLNPFIYSVVEEMAHLQVLRNQLNFLRAYLFTCREPVIDQLQKQMWPREYMYEHIHQYSILDLSDIRNGFLAQQLQKVVDFGIEHVHNCWLCSQKGFFCEVCNKPKALFPFDVNEIYRCDTCNAVYHKTCLNPSKPCPKCERMKRREEQPVLGVVQNDNSMF